MQSPENTILHKPFGSVSDGSSLLWLHGKNGPSLFLKSLNLPSSKKQKAARGQIMAGIREGAVMSPTPRHQQPRAVDGCSDFSGRTLPDSCGARKQKQHCHGLRATWASSALKIHQKKHFMARPGCGVPQRLYLCPHTVHMHTRAVRREP